MGVMFEIVQDNTDEILDNLDDAIERALESIGLQAEGYAKLACTAVDTGLLRNSITHAIAGKPAAIATYTATTPKKGKKNSGSYGSAPYEEHTVYIGTNVEYAPYVEFGHKLPSGKTISGIHFLKKGVSGHNSEFQQLAEAALKGF